MSNKNFMLIAVPVTCFLLYITNVYDRNPYYTQLVDKYQVKQVLRDIIDEHFFIPSYGVWHDTDAIEWEKLPNQFVLKTTHDSGGVIICHDKNEFDINWAKKELKKHLRKNFYYVGREWPYKNVQPRVMAEKYITTNGEVPRDYKFFCFNGVVKLFKIDFDRFTGHSANYYDRNCNLLMFGENLCPPDYSKNANELFNCVPQMILIAEKLSQKISFVRVDLFDINGIIYFGEMTFFPNSGFGTFTDEKWDFTMGDWLKLPSEKKCSI